ncbi:hypothetical protein L914_16999, partial [Phytophthora nicotianae]
MHLDEDIGQRRFVSSFIKNYAALHAPEQYLPQLIIPDTVDEINCDNKYRDGSETISNENTETDEVHGEGDIENDHDGTFTSESVNYGDLERSDVNISGDAVGNEHSTPDLEHCRMLIQAEDFGGGISMPHYGHIRPSVDYFNSNLILQNFVVADIDNNINHVYFYDERAQGKDADALCSLRLNYHLAKLLGNLHSNLPPAE